MKKPPLKKEFDNVTDRHDEGIDRFWNQPSGPLEEKLLKAAENGNAPEVAELIKKGANVFVNSEMPLLLAAQNGHLPVVKLLVAEGSLGVMRYTAPTFKAEANGHKEVANYLKKAMKAASDNQRNNKPPQP